MTYKYNEEQILEDVKNYIESTYAGHYIGTGNVQLQDIIISTGHAESFYIGNILKLAARYGRKEGKNKKDLFKIIHYTFLLLHLLIQENKNEQLSQDNNSRNP